MRATDGRAERCPHCSGMIRKPNRKQHPTLAEVVVTHLATCPGKP